MNAPCEAPTTSTKSDTVAAIRRLNPFISIRFLDGFSDRQLRAYLARLDEVNRTISTDRTKSQMAQPLCRA